MFAPDAVNTALEPEQTVAEGAGVKTKTGNAFTVIAAVAVFVQVFAFVPVMV